MVSGAKTVEGGAAGGVPDFWLTVLQRSEFIKETITEKDEEVLKYLRVRRRFKHCVLHSM